MHKIECNACHELFYPADLAEVIKHEHIDLACEANIGVCVQRTFTEKESPNIKRLAFDYEKNTIDVLFHNDQDYRYFDVPVQLMAEFSNSDKPGAFLAQRIKGHYRFYHLNGD